MLTLGINTASSSTSIAIFQDGVLLDENTWKSDNNEAEKLMPAIQILLEKNHQNFADIAKVWVIKGPGSFTGLRVGVTVANTIAYLNKCELQAVNTFEYLWATQTNPTPSKALVVYAGSGGVYVSHSPEKEGEVVNLPDINDHLKKHKITEIFGDITSEQKAQITEAKFTESSETFGKTLEKIPTTKWQTVEIVQPLYIKQPGITQSKKPTF